MDASEEEQERATRLAALELLAHGYRGFSTGSSPVPRRVVRRLLRQLTASDKDMDASPSREQDGEDGAIRTAETDRLHLAAGFLQSAQAPPSATGGEAARASAPSDPTAALGPTARGTLSALPSLARFALSSAAR